MELRFRISAEQCQALADRITAKRIARIAARKVAMQARIDAFLQRSLAFVLLVIPLAVVALMRLMASSGQGVIATWLPFAVAAFIYGLLWWRYGLALARFVLRIAQWFRARLDRITDPFIANITRRSVQRSVARLEGLHRWELSPAALSVQGPSGKTAVIPWQKIARLHDLGDVYQLFTRTSSRFGLAYYLAKSSSEMDADAYGDALRQLAERVPEQTAAA
ncbi:hypothetical protein PI87_17145 [Ralstonia sp. A12]|uniref:hypothetical protein n=1 Tax=Ralstonia sp. A12 TaxID=1217052 RepID=UPI00057529B5|nr:hypothetical protein [Ralstonia sp. A12]KHK53568.1 hypothetical protein PI87_17145 [Ralstonia sp. A12]